MSRNWLTSFYYLAGVCLIVTFFFVISVQATQPSLTSRKLIKIPDLYCKKKLRGDVHKKSRIIQYGDRL
jgi:hypothetical protein